MYFRFVWQFVLGHEAIFSELCLAGMAWTLANKRLFLGLISYCSPVVTSSRNLAQEVDECPTEVVMLVHNYNSVGQVLVSVIQNMVALVFWSALKY